VKADEVEEERKNAQAILQIGFEESRFSIERVSFESTLIVIVKGVVDCKEMERKMRDYGRVGSP
jgi:hypothetical protein